MNFVPKIKEVAKPQTAEIFNSRYKYTDHLAFICHEIKSPLAAIIGFSHIISSKEYSAQKKAECAEGLCNSSNILNGLMKDLLNSFKMEAGMIEIENIEFSPAKVVREAMHVVAVSAAEKCIALNVHMEVRVWDYLSAKILHI